MKSFHLVSCLMAVLMGVISDTAWGQNYPTKDITLVIP
jgi:hypothetical protein